MKTIETSSITIENIVSSGSLADSIDLESIAGRVDGCTFSKKKFPGAVYHMQSPKSVALIFASGKIVLTGIVRHEDIPTALFNLHTTFRTAGITCRDKPEVGIRNIVCTYNLKKPCNLVRIMITLLDHEQVEYEPECFPGLVCRITDPKLVFLIFSSGKIVITGGTNMADIRRGLLVLLERLRVTGNFNPEN